MRATKLSERVVQTLLKTNADGQYAISDETLADLTAVLVLSAMRNDPELPVGEDIAELIASFCGRAGIESSTPSADVAMLVDSYVQNNPFDNEVKRMLNELLAAYSDGARHAAKAFSKFMGGAENRGILQSSSRPDGAVQMNPLTMHLMRYKRI